MIYLGAGYNGEIFYPPKNYEKKNNIELLYVGKFDESKGFYELIEAFKIISEKRDDVNLTLIGALRKKDKEKIETAVREIKNITVHDFLNQKKHQLLLKKQKRFIKKVNQKILLIILSLKVLK